MGNICIIGPRESGKTTYLAALAYCFENSNKNIRVHPLTADASKIAEKAENIIRRGGNLEPTRIDGLSIINVQSLPYYSFKIEIKKGFKKPEEITLVLRDYPGEIFEELKAGVSNNLHEEFIEECLMKDIVGCLILIARWDREIDDVYSKVIKRFTELMDARNRAENLRLAVGLSKCERGEIWPGRIDPEMDLFEGHLPKTTNTLRAKVPARNLEFYAISTFGVLGQNNPRPNRADELSSPRSALRKPEKWQPYGMISPLYWLSTGKRMRADV